MSRTGSKPKDTNAMISRIAPIVPENEVAGDDQLQHEQAEPEPEEDEREIGVEQSVQDREPGSHRPFRDSETRQCGNGGRGPVAERHGRAAHGGEE